MVFCSGSYPITKAFYVQYLVTIGRYNLRIKNTYHYYWIKSQRFHNCSWKVSKHTSSIENNFWLLSFEAGVTFGNSFFDNCFVFLRQCKDRLFLGTFTVHKKVEVRINRSQTGEDLTSINSNFDFLRLG